MEELSSYIIKPKAFDQKFEIIKKLEYAGLFTTHYKVGRLTHELIQELHPSTKTNPQLHLARYAQYQTSRCVIGIVEGENAISELVRICGLNPDPLECEPGTIRREFGLLHSEHSPGSSNLLIFHNAIHRPKNKEELEIQLKIFNKISKVKFSS